MGVMRQLPIAGSIGLVVTVLAIATAVTDAAAQFDRSYFLKHLREKAAFAPEDLAALEAGQTVVKTIKTGDKQETAVVGVVKTTIDGSVPLDRFRASFSQKRSDEIGPGAKFSSPPINDDLRSLELEEKDIEELERCFVGNCDLNMTEKMIVRINASVDGSAVDRSQKMSEAYRSLLAEIAAAYEARGAASLEPLVNRRKPVPIGEDHRSLLSRSLFLRDAAPKLYSFLQNFPKGDDDVENALYWSTVEFGLKPMIAISHVAADAEISGGGERFAIATRQIYASRYIDSSLTLSFLFRFADDGKSEAYLVFADRTRSDALGGLLGGIARSVAEQQGKERVKQILERSRDQLKASLAVTPAGPEQPQTEAASGTLTNRAVVIIAALAILAVAIAVWLMKRDRFKR